MLNPNFKELYESLREDLNNNIENYEMGLLNEEELQNLLLENTTRYILDTVGVKQIKLTLSE